MGSVVAVRSLRVKVCKVLRGNREDKVVNQRIYIYETISWLG